MSRCPPHALRVVKVPYVWRLCVGEEGWRREQRVRKCVYYSWMNRKVMAESCE